MKKSEGLQSRRKSCTDILISVNVQPPMEAKGCESLLLALVPLSSKKDAPLLYKENLLYIVY